MTVRPYDWSPIGLDVDPTPGDPVLVLAGGREYLDVADSIDSAASAMSRLTADGTISHAVDALIEKKEDTISDIRKAYRRYVAAGEALMDYAGALERVQAETAAALGRARSAQDDAHVAQGTQDRLQEQADTATDPQDRADLERSARQAGDDLATAHAAVSSARSDVESAVADRDRAAEHAISRIEDITKSDDLNDSWWDNWGSKVVAAIADVADMVSTIAGILAIVVAFIPVVGQALAGVLIVIAAVAAIVSALANIALAATGKRSWAEAGLAIAGAALSVIGLGAAAKAATGLSRVALREGLKEGLEGGLKQGAKRAWCKLGFGQCFVAGTLVRTADGDRPIEQIRAGDKVWARDVATGVDALYVVNETFVRPVTELYHLMVDGRRVSTTSEHPFMVQDMGWVHAKDLVPGDRLVTPGVAVPLAAVDVEQRAEGEPVLVYNIHVDVQHNYFVVAGGHVVLVHNMGDHVKALDVGPYATLKKAEKVGDNLEHDHIPSSAALKKAKEQALGRKLTPKEASEIHDQGITIEVPKEVHAKGDTWRGKNNQQQIASDASDLSAAAERDYATQSQNLIDHGYDPKDVAAAIDKMRELNGKRGI